MFPFVDVNIVEFFPTCSAAREMFKINVELKALKHWHDSESSNYAL